MMNDATVRSADTFTAIANVLDEVKSQFSLGHNESAEHLLEVLIESIEDDAVLIGIKANVDNVIDDLVRASNLIEANSDLAFEVLTALATAFYNV